MKYINTLFLFFNFLIVKAQIVIEKPTNLKVECVAPDMVRVDFTWNLPQIPFPNSRKVVFKIKNRNLNTNLIIQNEYSIHGITKNKNSFSFVVSGLTPSERYIFYLDIDIFEVLDPSIVEYSSPVSDVSDEVTTVSRNFGITLITHGFSLSGEFNTEFTDYAQQIRNRIGGNATIYINVGNGKRMYWKKISGNGTGEIIFVYDWAKYSNALNGNLEAASDRLFSLLISPIDENNKLINSNNVGELLQKKPTHFIGHSRGTILLLQTLHRLLEYYPELQIQQYTALDPHPAAKFGDISSELTTSTNLPFVVGVATECSSISQICSNGSGIRISVPENVLYADCYYRQDNFYEDLITNLSPAPFDGVAFLDEQALSRDLNDNVLALPPSSGGAHSRVHSWYFGTVKLSQEIDSRWYFGDDDRALSGFYHTNLGGGINKLPLPKSKVSRETARNQISIRQNGRPLDVIFNGFFDKGVISWNLSEQEAVIFTNINNTLNAYAGSTNKAKLTHDFFYIPTEKRYLEFDILPSAANNSTLNLGTTVIINWFANGFMQKNIGPQCIKTENIQQKYYVEIPEELRGKIGGFSLEFINSVSSSIGSFQIDNFDLVINKPTNGIGIGSGHCCQNTNNIAFKILVTTPKYNLDTTSRILTLCNGLTTTLSTEGCSGLVIWNEKDTLSSIQVASEKYYEAKCVLGEECVRKYGLTVKYEDNNPNLTALAGADRSYCLSTGGIFNLDAEKPKIGIGKWVENSYIMYRFSDINDPKTSVTILNTNNSLNFEFIWQVEAICSNRIVNDAVNIQIVLPRPMPTPIPDIPHYYTTWGSPVEFPVGTDPYLEFSGLDGNSNEENYRIRNGRDITIFKEGIYTFKATATTLAPCKSPYTTFKVTAACPPCPNGGGTEECWEKCHPNGRKK